MRETAETVKHRLEALLPYADLRPENLHEAMRYAVLGGGKRLRPVLTLAAYSAVGGDDASRGRAVDGGCALELLHCYRLVHDDLPCMDNDSLRRNRLTCHKAFGETVAVLVGDALQSLAFRTLAEASGVQAARTVAELARAAGSTGMAGGQFLDYEGEGKRQELEEIERIDRWKSGAMFTACCRIGAVLGGADGLALEKLTCCGDAIGMAHQIADDIVDFSGDAHGEKLTYPAALGIDGAREAVSRKAAEAKDSILDFGKEALHLRLFADYLLDRVKE
jgi:geranylgeranyl pyrophosphate synthase